MCKSIPVAYIFQISPYATLTFNRTDTICPVITIYSVSAGAAYFFTMITGFRKIGQTHNGWQALKMSHRMNVENVPFELLNLQWERSHKVNFIYIASNT